MQTLTNPSSPVAATDRRPVLRRHGFKPAAGGWHRGPVAFRDERGWLAFTAPAPEMADPLRDLGAPGLWKPDCVKMRRVFAIRESWTNDDDWMPAEEDRGTFDAVVEWALA